MNENEIDTLSDIEIYKCSNNKNAWKVIAVWGAFYIFLGFFIFIISQYGILYFSFALACGLVLLFIGLYSIIKSLNVYKKLEKLQTNGVKAEGIFNIKDITQGRDPGFAATLSGEITNPVSGEKQVVKSNRFGGINWGDKSCCSEPYGRDDVADIKNLLESPLAVYFSPDGKDYIVNIAPVYRLVMKKNKTKWKFMTKSMYIGFGVLIIMYILLLIIFLYLPHLKG